MKFYTETVRTNVFPSMREKIEQFAKEDGVSISTCFRKIIEDHLLKKNGFVSPTKPLPQYLLAEQQRPERGGYVYLIRCGERYKIGRAVNVERRIGVMSLPMRPQIIATVFSLEYGPLEKKLHAMFAKQRVHGEWFELTDDEVELVKLAMDP